MSDAMDRVVAGLDLEELDRDLYLGDPGQGTGRLFGGMVAAQSVMAAQLTVDQGRLHGVHAFFLRGGSYGRPIRFAVDRIRDGRTYTTRRVVALQGGKAIFSLSASFTKPEEGPAYQAAIPEVPEPESLPLWQEVLQDRGVQGPRGDYVDAFEVRMPWDDALPRGERFMWMRPVAPPPADPRLHTALITFASDRGLMRAAVSGMGYERRQIVGTSLDHALWLHREALLDDWVLYTAWSRAGFAARGLSFGEMYTREGVLFASVAQEGLIRLPRARPAG